MNIKDGEQRSDIMYYESALSAYTVSFEDI